MYFTRKVDIEIDEHHFIIVVLQVINISRYFAIIQ